MNKEKIENNIQQESYFLWDLFLNYILFVSFFLLLFRLFFTFLFAFLYSQRWHIEKLWDWLPVIVFNSDIDTFTTMNSNAIIATSAVIFIIFFTKFFTKKSIEKKYKIYAWYLGVVMLLVQYEILIILNKYLRYSIDTNLWLFFWLIFFVATIILLFWKVVIKK